MIGEPPLDGGGFAKQTFIYVSEVTIESDSGTSYGFPGTDAFVI